MPELRFDCHLESDQGACFIRVPPEVLTMLGERKRAPVKVTINATTYRTTIAVYGGKSYIGVRREVQEAAGVAAGESLTVGLEYDPELRTVDLPEALRAKLEADPKAAAATCGHECRYALTEETFRTYRVNSVKSNSVEPI